MSEGGKAAVPAVKRTPVSDASAPRLKELLGGKVGDAIIETIRGVEAAANDKVSPATVNAAAALNNSRDAKAAAQRAEGKAAEAVSTADGAKANAAEALGKADAAKATIDALSCADESGTEVKGPEAFAAMAAQLARNTSLLSSHIEGVQSADAAAQRASGAADAAFEEARAARAAATEAAQDALVSREQVETASAIVQGAAERHSDELGRVETKLEELKRALNTAVGNMAKVKVVVDILLAASVKNSLISPEDAEAIEKALGGVK